jgi:hypothetical protein
MIGCGDSGTPITLTNEIRGVAPFGGSDGRERVRLASVLLAGRAIASEGKRCDMARALVSIATQDKARNLAFTIMERPEKAYHNGTGRESG